ncbi:uncharacterized protein LOC124912410 [Impatiens glandulifera]|uniref:uncharacterized protein LOC124912410 n=1 Tax=Impatiens glandulifera TaxID=253017 RepID=UPI001FB102C6|nr:uncharacterized protein LOC124912410 [Impatiens glandulifera]
MGVNDSYEHVVDNMLASDPWPSVHKAFTILVNVETKRNISISKGEYTAMMVKEKTELNNKNQKIEGSSKLPAEKFKPYKNSICTHCGLKGHIKEGCFKLLGYPEWFKQSRKKQVAVNTANMANSPLDDIEEHVEVTGSEYKQFKEWCKANSKGKGKVAAGTSEYSAGP